MSAAARCGAILIGFISVFANHAVLGFPRKEIEAVFREVGRPENVVIIDRPVENVCEFFTFKVLQHFSIDRSFVAEPLFSARANAETILRVAKQPHADRGVSESNWHIAPSEWKGEKDVLVDYFNMGSWREAAIFNEDFGLNLAVADHSINNFIDVNISSQLFLFGLARDIRLPDCLLCLPMRLKSGLSGFFQRPVAYEDSSNSSSNSEESQDSRSLPVSPLYAMMLALFGVPPFFYGLIRWKDPYPTLGYVVGAIGLGLCIADWARFGFWRF